MKYQNRETGEIGEFISRNDKYRTVTLKLENGSTRNYSVASINHYWKELPEENPVKATEDSKVSTENIEVKETENSTNIESAATSVSRTETQTEASIAEENSSNIVVSNNKIPKHSYNTDLINKVRIIFAKYLTVYTGTEPNKLRLQNSNKKTCAYIRVGKHGVHVLFAKSLLNKDIDFTKYNYRTRNMRMESAIIFKEEDVNTPAFEELVQALV